jgi:hypothetical protein
MNLRSQKTKWNLEGAAYFIGMADTELKARYGLYRGRLQTIPWSKSHELTNRNDNPAQNGLYAATSHTRMVSQVIALTHHMLGEEKQKGKTMKRG